MKLEHIYSLIAINAARITKLQQDSTNNKQTARYYKLCGKDLEASKHYKLAESIRRTVAKANVMQQALIAERKMLEVTSNGAWKTIEIDGQPSKSGLYEVLYKYEVEGDIPSLRRFNTEALRWFNICNDITLFGSGDTSGERYRKVLTA